MPHPAPSRPLAGPGLLAILLAAAAPAAMPAAAQVRVLEDIVVTPDRAPTLSFRAGSSVSTLGPRDAATDRRPFLADALARLPGVAVAQSGPPGTQTDIFLRGLPQRYVRVRVDGIEISDPTQPQVTPSLAGLPAGDLGRAEVLRGSQSALYGGQAVAGVIDVTTLRPSRDGVEQRLSVEGGRYATLSAAYGLTARGERGDLAVSLARFRTDGFSAAAAGTEPDGYATTRLSATGEHFLTDDARVFGSVFWQEEEGDQDAFRADADDSFAIRTRGARAGAALRLGPVESSLSASVFDIDRRFRDAAGTLTFGGEGRRSNVEYLGRIEAAPRLAVQFGADWNREEAAFLPTGVSADAWVAGAFLQGIWSPAEPLTLGAALRRDEHSAFGGFWTGRLTAAHALRGETVLRASLGTGFRPPSLNELFGPFGGNPDLEPETSLSYDLGIEQGFDGGRGRAAATLFRVEVDDLITYSDPGFLCFPPPAPAGVRCYVQETEGTTRTRGVELAAAWEASDRLRLTGAYTYTETERATGGRIPLVPRHVLALGADLAPTSRLSIGVTLRHVADAAPSFGEAPDDYTLVNGRVAYAIADGAEIALRGVNLLDQRYEAVPGYGTSRRAFFVGLAARF